MTNVHQLQNVDEQNLDQVIEVERSCFSDPWPRSAFMAELSHSWSHFKILVRHESSNDLRIDGYLIAWMLPEEMHLLKMAVLPEWQRRGLARQMLGSCLSTFSQLGGGTASLEVRPSNKAALGLYGSFGFTQIAVRRAYYSKDNEDALLFIKDVPGTPGGSLDAAVTGK